MKRESAPSKSSTYTTEEVVNIVGEKPSFLYVMLMFGLMSFNMMCAMVAYFPNFGGYVPYTDWRCLSGSSECLRRTSEFVDQGWQTASNTKEQASLESRCSIKLKQFNTSLHINTLQLYRDIVENEQHTRIGSINFNSNAQEINVWSYVECKNNKSSCVTDFPFSFDRDLKGFECHLIFAGSTLEQTETTIDCGASKLTLSGDEGVLTMVDQVKYIDLNGIGSYELHCPDKDQYNRDNLCGTGDSSVYDRQLKVGEDFYWYTQGRTSFSIDWDLYCDREFLRSMISSIYFGGAWIGTAVGGTLYDIIGRKRGAVIGYAVVISSSFALSASPSIEFLFVCRFLQGVGVFLGFTGMFVLMLEYTATKYRSIANSAILFFWAIGYLVVTMTGYLIKDWHWLASLSGFMYLGISLTPLLLTPESPRFLLVTKKSMQGAKDSLRWLIKLNKSSFDIDNAILEDNVEETKEPSFIDTMRDFWTYKEMLVQLVIQMWMWMVAAFIYYGFSFSWSSLGSNIYISYLYAAIGEAIAYAAMVFPLDYWGRRSSNIMFYLVGSASFLLAMIPYNVSGSFTVEQLSCLIGSMFVSAVFGSIYLYTMELAPTSHRGKMLGYCSFSARIGAFCGPQASLMFGWSRMGTLIIFAVLSGLAGLATLRLPDTKGVPTPSSAEEVQTRRHRRASQTQTVLSNGAAVE